MSRYNENGRQVGLSKEEWATKIDRLRQFLDRFPEAAAKEDDNGNIPLFVALNFGAPFEVIDVLLNKHPDGLLFDLSICIALLKKTDKIKNIMHFSLSIRFHVARCRWKSCASFIGCKASFFAS